jgi:hypothetical protein
VLLNLGRVDRRDHDGLRRLVGSINRYLGEGDGGGDALTGLPQFVGILEGGRGRFRWSAA